MRPASSRHLLNGTVDRCVAADIEVNNGNALLAQIFRWVAVLGLWIAHGSENDMAGASRCLNRGTAEPGTGASDQDRFGHNQIPSWWKLWGLRGADHCGFRPKKSRLAFERERPPAMDFGIWIIAPEGRSIRS
jgi:hypothetical protein